MNSDKVEQKRLQLFLNQPSFLKHYLQKSQVPMSRADGLKSIFPPSTQLERFRHLEDARVSGQRDLALDQYVLKLIGKFERQVSINAEKNSSLEDKRQNCLKKLKMDYVEQQMSENLDELQKLIGEYENLNRSISNEKGFVQKMIMMTSIKKALFIQNSILKKENEMLKKQEEEIDNMLRTRK